MKIIKYTQCVGKNKNGERCKNKSVKNKNWEDKGTCPIHKKQPEEENYIKYNIETEPINEYEEYKSKELDAIAWEAIKMAEMILNNDDDKKIKEQINKIVLLKLEGLEIIL